MKLFRIVLLVSALALVPSAVRAQAMSPVSSGDKQGIDRTLNSIGQSLTDMDFDKFSTFFTDDADWVNIVGMHWTGRAQIVKAHRVVFTTRYHGFPQHIVDESVTLLTPTVALAITTIKMDDYTAQDGKRMTNNLSRLTWVLEKHNGTWLVRSGQNTTIDPQAAIHDPGLAH